MASPSATPAAINLTPVSEKLVRSNYILWKAQVLAVLRSAQLAGFVEDTKPAPAEKIKIRSQDGKAEEEAPNPTFEVWKAQEQQVLSYLLISVSRDVLIQVAALLSAAAVWKHIETAFASQSRARVINTRMALATTQKGTSTMVEYVSKMRALADDMASVGKQIDDEEIISYILAGLDYEYNSLVSSVTARAEPITFSELYSQLLALETRLELQRQAAGGLVTGSESSVNNATRGQGGFNRGRGGRGPAPRGGNTSGGHGGGGGRGDSGYKPRNKWPPCQLCGKINHSIFKCYKRFDQSYMGEEKNVNAATSYGVDTNWYADSGATDHVTGELDKLAVRDTYNGNEHIYTASGTGSGVEENSNSR